MSINRAISKNLAFGMLYGGHSMNLLVPAPSLVERLGALTDPVLADRVLMHDNPSEWTRRIQAKWASMTSGLKEDASNITALMLEQETRYLKQLMSSTTKQVNAQSPFPPRLLKALPSKSISPLTSPTL